MPVSAGARSGSSPCPGPGTWGSWPQQSRLTGPRTTPASDQRTRTVYWYVEVPARPWRGDPMTTKIPAAAAEALASFAAHVVSPAGTGNAARWAELDARPLLYPIPAACHGCPDCAFSTEGVRPCPVH